MYGSDTTVHLTPYTSHLIPCRSHILHLTGLPSSGSGERVGWGAGVFTRHGSLPTVRSNVRLHAGWFNETVPRLLDAKHASTRGVAFVHLDADLYESTALVLEALGSRCAFRKGTVLSFDELFGTAAVLAHEYRALNEAAAKWQFKYEFISYAITRKSAYARAAVRITSRPQSAGSACELAAPVQPCRPRNVYIDAGVNWCVECRHPLGNAPALNRCRPSLLQVQHAAALPRRTARARPP